MAKRNIYVDGIWDLFHTGHLKNIKSIKKLDGKDNFLIVGVVSDKDASNYKRQPIIEEKQRVEIIKSLKYVDKVIENCPLVINEEFLEKNNIDLVCHGFLEKADFDKQKEFFQVPISLNKFRQVPYNYGISTTDIIQKIKNL